jgi:glutathione S-transferase
LPGPEPYEQIPALAERGRRRIEVFFDLLDGRLAESPFVACERYTYADIAAYVYLGFATRVTGASPADTREPLRRWAEEIAGRPAVAAPGT